MPATTQVNVRMDATLKQSGDAVFSRFGLKPSDVIRAVWSYAAKHQTLPDFLQTTSASSQATSKDASIVAEDCCGLAIKLAESQAGIEFDMSKPAPDWEEEKAAMYDDLYEEMKRRCR